MTNAFKFLFFYYRFRTRTKYTLYVDYFKASLQQVTLYTVRSKYVLDSNKQRPDFSLHIFDNVTKDMHGYNVSSIKQFLLVVLIKA